MRSVLTVFGIPKKTLRGSPVPDLLLLVQGYRRFTVRGFLKKSWTLFDESKGDPVTKNVVNICLMCSSKGKQNKQSRVYFVINWKKLMRSALIVTICDDNYLISFLQG